jgi:thiamine pyrophosphokinase
MGCRVAIVCNGQFPRSRRPLGLLAASEHVVCCDGALSALLRRGITPSVVIGDMDSVSVKALEQYSGQVVRSSDQETNDQTKALHYALSAWPDVSEIWILGASGRSEAHTIGNLSLLMEYEKSFGLSARGIRLRLVSDYCEAFAVYSDRVEFAVAKGQKVSLFSPDNTLVMHSEGLVWPTDAVVWDNWWKATLNRASGTSVTLTLNHPAPVLILLDPIK